MSCGDVEDRCEEDCRCQQLSSDYGGPVLLYRLWFKWTPVMDPGGLRIASTTKSCHSGL